MQLVAKNNRIELAITAMSSDGAGIGRVDGMAVFVPGTAIGDVAEVQIIKVTKSYAVGKLLSLIAASPARISPDCDVFSQCGGCVYRHISYEEECRIKQSRVADALHRIGGLSLEVEPIIASERVEGYRNKAQYPVGRASDGSLAIGFYAARSHRIVDSRTCRLQPKEFDEALAVFAEWMEQYAIEPYDEASGRGVVRHLYLRCAPTTGQKMVCVVTATKTLPHAAELCDRLLSRVEGLCSILHNVHPERTNLVLGKRFATLWGEEFIEDVLCGLRFRISPLSFYQVNSPQAERLYRKAAELAELREDDILLDLYCGTGTIGLTMASKVKRVIGVEVVSDAVEDAKRNADANGIANAEFLCMDASQAAEKLAADRLRPSVVLIDPPRKGCTPELIKVVSREMQPEQVVYVSCDPATLARDAALFEKEGYQAVRAVPVDLFPRTSHVETVCLLSKLNAKQHIEIDLSMDELDLTDAEKKATYQEIKDYVLEHSGLKVSSLYIAQVKQKCGIIERENYNKPKSEDAKQPQCPPDKEKAIKETLRHFGMI